MIGASRDRCGRLARLQAGEARELDWSLESVQLPAQVSGLVDYPGRVGMRCAIRVQDASAVDLHEHGHIQRLEEDSVDGEKVAGQDRAGMGVQELRPGGALAARSGRDSMAAENAANGGRRDFVSELEDLSLDPPIMWSAGSNSGRFTCRRSTAT